jgi:transcriptional regulator with PAS, ATPase and Fis domain
MNGTHLFSDQSRPMSAADGGAFQRIADLLAGSGVETVRLDVLETAAIHVALGKTDGNRTHAAKVLGISVRTLQRKLKAENVIDGRGEQNGRS